MNHSSHNSIEAQAAAAVADKTVFAMTGTPAAAGGPPPIQERFESLEFAIMALSDVVDQLESLINPVLLPSDDLPPTPTGDTVPESPVARRVLGAKLETERQTARLIGLVRRVQL